MHYYFPFLSLFSLLSLFSTKIPKVEAVSESVNRVDASVEVLKNGKYSPEDELLRSLKKQSVVEIAAVANVSAKKQRVVKEPYIAVKAVIPVAEKRNGGYDPFEAVDPQKLKVLEDWLMEDPKYKERIAGSSAEWFYILRTPTEWLGDTHMDDAIYLLRLRYSKHPEDFRSARLCFLDTMFARMWSAKFGEFKSSRRLRSGAGRLLPGGSFQHYIGEEPVYCRSNKAWVLEVDDLYAPLHVTKDHWVAMWISLPRRHIVVWDSSSVHVRDGAMAKAIEPFTVMLPHLLQRFSPSYPLHPFTFQRFKGGSVPENFRSGDCGVYCMKYIECHALGIPFPKDLCDSNMTAIKDKLAGEIFDETSLCGKENRLWNYLD